MSDVVTDSILALARPESLVDPYPAYARLRAEHPISWNATLDSWVMTRYEDCVAVLRDSARFAADWRRTGADMPPQAISVQTLDPPEHTEIRRVLIEAIRAQDGAATEHIIAEQVRDLLARLAGRSSFDFVTEFAEPLAQRCPWDAPIATH
jgi:cytochrome P450